MMAMVVRVGVRKSLASLVAARRGPVAYPKVYTMPGRPGGTLYSGVSPVWSTIPGYAWPTAVGTLGEGAVRCS